MNEELRWLEGLKSRGIRIGLERMNSLMKDYALDYRIIHVGGTNGKGSVCQFIGKILQEEGYNVGIYSSPHLERLNERITINGEEISDSSLSKIAGVLMKKDRGMTFFEAMTAIALIYFREKVDFAVIEVGMGGRYDATNVVDAEITAITNVSREHEQYLGNNLVEIAAEKAGIIKGGDVVTACSGEPLNVIEKKAKECDAKLHVVGRDITWKRMAPKKFWVKSRDEYELETRLSGIFQGDNISISVRVAELMGTKRESIVNGVRKAFLPARMEKAGKFLIDGAHNPAGVKAMRDGLKDFRYDNLFIIFGAMKDKNIETMIKFLPEGKIIATSIGGERAADAGIISAIARKAGRECMKENDVSGAIKKAMEMAGKDDLICITGSLYLAGKTRKILKEMGIKFPSPL